MKAFKGDPSSQDFDEWCGELRRIWEEEIKRRRNGMVVIAAGDISCHDAVTTLGRTAQPDFPYSHASENLGNALLHSLVCERCRSNLFHLLRGQSKVSS
jgi:hypothetical protein